MRADRLIAALMLLQTRQKITARELASELEISERTARRDLDALAMSGVPIYSQPGRGGGWRLVGGATTDLTGLSSDEARALFVALAEQGDRSGSLDAALRKLVVAVPEQFRDDAVMAATSIRVDPAGWGQMGRERPPLVDMLSEAVVEQRQCRISYQRPSDDEPTARQVHPLGLVTKRGVWYLIANTDRGLRTYRASRVRECELLDDRVERPVGFDLDLEWQRIVAHVEAQRHEVVTRVIVSPERLVPVRFMFAARYTEHEQLADGSVVATLSEGSAASMAAQLAGLGAGVELIDPPVEVAVEMRRIASELAETWL